MITLTREEAQQVLNALEAVWYHVGTFAPTEHAVDLYDRAIKLLRAKLSEPEPEAVAYDFQKALFLAYHLGQRYWADADSESYSANKRADKHRQDFDALCEEVISYTAPPQREWQSLTDDDLHALHYELKVQCMGSTHPIGMYRILEKALKEKNT